MWKTSMGIHDRKSQTSDRIVPKNLCSFVTNWKDRYSQKLDIIDYIFYQPATVVRVWEEAISNGAVHVSRRNITLNI